jgi:hypothetical protein
MAEPLLLGCAAVAAFVGLAWLALGMSTHWAQVHPAGLPSRWLRWAGVVALGLSLGLCLAADHPSMAALVWLMLLAASAVAVAMTLASRPHWLRWVWPAAGQA